MLNIPIKHVGGSEGRQKYKEVEVDNSSNWQKQHWRTLETAYRTSPFFEFYEYDLKPLFEESANSLFQFNLKTTQVISNLLGIKISEAQTDLFEPSPDQIYDWRFLVEAKKPLAFKAKPYTQVFSERHGFIPNLSVLDLLFNDGTNALAYLKNQNLDFLNA